VGRQSRIEPTGPPGDVQLKYPLSLAGKHLLYFVAVADHGSIGAAAEALHLTQPALTKSIRALERMLRTQLLYRSVAGVRPTAQGERVLAHARAVLGSLRELASELGSSPSARRSALRLGMNPLVSSVLIADAVELLAAEGTGVQMQILEASVPGVLQRLRAGELDLAILSGEDLQFPAEVDAEPLGRDRPTPIGSARTAGGEPRCANISIVPPVGHPLRGAGAAAALRSAASVAIETATLARAVQLAELLGASAQVPASWVPGERPRDSGELPWELTIWLALRRGGHSSPLVRAFIAGLKRSAGRRLAW